jgi:hypothetical protein
MQTATLAAAERETGGVEKLSETKKGHPFGVALFRLDGAPDTIRTCDRLVRSQVLYPAELRAREGRYYKDVVFLSQELIRPRGG